MTDSIREKRPFVTIRVRGDTQQRSSEKYIEQKLVEAVRRNGGRALKFVSPGCDGVPDRIILMPGGRIVFAEVKRPGGKMRPLQMRRKLQLESLGFRVYLVDGTEQIEKIMKEVMPDGVHST